MAQPAQSAQVVYRTFEFNKPDKPDKPKMRLDISMNSSGDVTARITHIFEQFRSKLCIIQSIPSSRIYVIAPRSQDPSQKLAQDLPLERRGEVIKLAFLQHKKWGCGVGFTLKPPHELLDLDISQEGGSALLKLVDTVILNA